MKLLVTYKIPKASFDELPEDWEVISPEGEFFTTEEIITLIPDCDALLSIFTQKIDNRVLEAGKRLKIASNFGVGYNNIDVAYARELGIAVTNTPQAVCFPTAEMTFALMLAVARRVAECDHRVRVEREPMWGVMKNLGMSLEGKVLGLVGMGRIGKMVAKMAAAFRMNVIYTAPHTRVADYTWYPLDELLNLSDVVSLHLPYSASTHHLIGEKEFALMKPSAIFINTARGAVVDEAALTEALKAGRIHGAGLDVFEREPVITEALYSMDNVVLAPHNGTGTIDTRINTGREAVENILAFFRGEPRNVVN